MIGHTTNSWGGYIEWAYYLGSEWVRCPNTLNIFYDVDIQQKKVIRRDRAILYDNTENFSSIFVTNFSNTVGFHIDCFDSDEQNIENPILKDGWLPNYLTIVFILHDKEKPFEFICKSFEYDRLNFDLHFQSINGAVNFQDPSEIINDLILNDI